MNDFIQFFGENIFLIIVVMFVAAGILGAVAKYLEKQQEAENKTQPINSGIAKIVDMQKIETGVIIIGEPWILFELDNGTRIRLNAKPQNNLVVGDIGMLTWQGRKILKFERKVN